MAKGAGFIALMTKIGDKLGKAVFDDVAKYSDDIAKLAEKAKGSDLNIEELRKVSKTIKKKTRFHKWINEGIDNIVFSRYNMKTDQLKAVAESGENAILQDAANRSKTFGVELTLDDYSDINKLTGKLKDAAYKKTYNEFTNNWMTELHGYGGNDELARVVAKSLKKNPAQIKTAMETGQIEAMFSNLDVKTSKELNKNVGAAVAAARSVAGKTLRESKRFGTIDKHTGTINDKISLLHDEFLRNGNKAGADACKMAKRYVDNAAAIETLNRAAKFNVENLLNEVPLEKRQKMREYVSEMDVNRFSFADKIDDGIGIPKRIEGDWQLASNLGLSVDDVARVNKIKNYDRITLYGESKRELASSPKDLDDVTREVSALYENISDDAIIFKENLTAGDVRDIGINYWPAKPNAEHKEAIRLAKVEKYGESSIESYWGDQIATHRMMRDPKGSKLVKDYSLREDPLVEYMSYFDSVSVENTRKAGAKYLDSIGKRATVYDLLNNSKKYVEGARDYAPVYKEGLNNILTDWHNMFAVQQQPTNVIMKGIAHITDMNTALALGQSITGLLGPAFGNFGAVAEGGRMPFFNFLQVLPTTAMFKGILPTLGAMYEAPSANLAYLKSVKQNSIFKKMTSKGNIEGAIDIMTEGIKDPLLKKAFSDYWKYEAPDVTMQELYSMNGKVQKVFSALTTIFKLSDVSARGVGLTAAVRYGERQYAKYADDISKGSAKAIDRLVQDMHLYEFNSLDREYIMEAMRNKEEFLSRFARMSVRSELYNYSRYFRPAAITASRTHWAKARAARFLSWNMYYANLLKGVKRSYDAGDKAPMRNAAMLASTWFGALYLGGLVDDDTVDSYVTYGIGRTPVIAPIVGTVGTTYRELTGIMAPSISTAVVLPIKVADSLFDLIDNEKTDSVDYIYEKVYNNFKRSPVLRVPGVKDLFDITEEFIQED